MGLVYKVNQNWEEIQSYWEVDEKDPKMMFPYDGRCPVFITDRFKAQVIVIRSGSKYGVYTGDHTNGTGGPGTWCNPTKDPFPYDEIKYFANPCVYPNVPALFAFRIGSKWGIIEVIDGEEETDTKYEDEYLLTKRRILVPCKYASLHEAELQLGRTYEWEEPEIDEARGDCSDFDGGTAQCVRELIETGYDMKALPLRMFTRGK